MVRVRQVIDPSPDEFEHVLTVLHETFSRRYFYSALGSEDLSKEFLESHIASALLDPAGEVWVVELESSDSALNVIGVAVWFGPGTTYLGTKEQREAGWDQLYAKLDHKYQEWWDYLWPTYEAYTTRVLGEGVKLNGYHLQALGVLAAHRRQGYAAQLFAAVEPKAKALGVCTCLETVGTGAVPVYRSLGYDVKEPMQLKSANDPNATAPMYAFIKLF